MLRNGTLWISQMGIKLYVMGSGAFMSCMIYDCIASAGKITWNSYALATCVGWPVQENWLAGQQANMQSTRLSTATAVLPDSSPWLYMLENQRYIIGNVTNAAGLEPLRNRPCGLLYRQICFSFALMPVSHSSFGLFTSMCWRQ